MSDFRNENDRAGIQGCLDVKVVVQICGISVVMAVALEVNCKVLFAHHSNLCMLILIPAQNCVKIQITISIFNGFLSKFYYAYLRPFGIIFFEKRV